MKVAQKNLAKGIYSVVDTKKHETIWSETIQNVTENKIFANIINCAKKNPAGFTINKLTGEAVKVGFAVAILATQNCFGYSGASKVAKVIVNDSRVNCVGGWYNSENEKYYLDGTAVFMSLEAAMIFARENKQIAIYDLSNGREIRVNYDK